MIVVPSGKKHCISDEHFGTIHLSESERPGVLGLGAVHMLTSYSRRTSPVLRGGWVLETILTTRLAENEYRIEEVHRPAWRSYSFFVGQDLSWRSSFACRELPGQVLAYVDRMLNETWIA